MHTYCHIIISIASSDSDSQEKENKNTKLLAARKFIDNSKYRKMIFKAAFPNGHYLKVTKQPLYWISNSKDELFDGWIYWGSSDVKEEKITKTIWGCEVTFDLIPITNWELRLRSQD